ncbi:MAG: peptidylprolyl isomerase [Acidobacteriota bacterium]
MKAWLPLVVVASLLAGNCARPVPLEEDAATASLGEPERFYTPRGPIEMVVGLFNPGPATLRIGRGIVDGTHLELRDAHGKRLDPHPMSDPAPDPGLIAPGQRVQFRVELLSLFPASSQPGDYTLTVVYPRFRSNTIALKVLPAFRADADYRADVVTDRGTITLKFFPDIAPNHVKNFINLSRAGFYDNILFHRIVRGMAIQSGDPTRTGRGGPGYTLRAEFSDRPQKRGTLSMAREGSDPNSAGSQWFICVDRVPEWDGKYTVFGEVVSGMEVVDAISRVRVKKEVPQESVVLKRIIIRERNRR